MTNFIYWSFAFLLGLIVIGYLLLSASVDRLAVAAQMEAAHNDAIMTQDDIALLTLNEKDIVAGYLITTGTPITYAEFNRLKMEHQAVISNADALALQKSAL